MTPRETENNAYAKFWDDKQSIMVCYGIFWSGQFCMSIVFSLSWDGCNTQEKIFGGK